MWHDPMNFFFLKKKKWAEDKSQSKNSIIIRIFSLTPPTGQRTTMFLFLFLKRSIWNQKVLSTELNWSWLFGGCEKNYQTPLIKQSHHSAIEQREQRPTVAATTSALSMGVSTSTLSFSLLSRKICGLWVTSLVSQQCGPSRLFGPGQVWQNHQSLQTPLKAVALLPYNWWMVLCSHVEQRTVWSANGSFRWSGPVIFTSTPLNQRFGLFWSTVTLCFCFIECKLQILFDGINSCQIQC